MIRPNEHLLQIVRIAERMEERAHAVRLDRNERVTPFPAPVFREMLAALTPESFSAYPDPSPLYRRLSHELGLPEEFLYLTNGSDAAIRMIFQTYVRPDDVVVFADPTYAMYDIYSQVFQAKSKTLEYDLDRRLDVAALFRLLESRPRLLAVANPDQPTGAVLPEETLVELAKATREAGSLFMVDEAYYPFYPRTVVPLVQDYNHLILTRSFSKVGGLAGLRLGYFVAHPSIVQNIQRIRGAHEVNAVAIAVGSYILDHPEIGEEHIRQVEAGRRVLADVSGELGLGFPECPTNFQLISFPGVTDTAGIVAALKERGYLVKGGFSSQAVRDCIRVTLGAPEVMRGFADALRAVCTERRGADFPAGVAE